MEPKDRWKKITSKSEWTYFVRFDLSDVIAIVRFFMILCEAVSIGFY